MGADCQHWYAVYGSREKVRNQDGLIILERDYYNCNKNIQIRQIIFYPNLLKYNNITHTQELKKIFK